MRYLVFLAIGFVVTSCSSSDADDPRTQARSYARDDLACATADDCCVVFDGCKASGLIVAAKDKDHVASLLASAPRDACLKCVAPAVDVRCVAGKCSGAVMVPPPGGDLMGGADGMKDHCGAITFPSGWSEKTQSLPGDFGPGLEPQLVLGC